MAAVALVSPLDVPAADGLAETVLTGSIPAAPGDAEEVADESTAAAADAAATRGATAAVAVLAAAAVLRAVCLAASSFASCRNSDLSEMAAFSMVSLLVIYGSHCSDMSGSFFRA